MRDLHITMKRYLLGELPADDAEEIERRYFEDDETLHALEEAEHDLLDDEASGRLSAEERRRFQSHFLAAAPERRRGLLVARMLARSLALGAPGMLPRAHPGVLAPPPVWALHVGVLRGDAGLPVFDIPAGAPRAVIELQCDHAGSYPAFRAIIVTASQTPLVDVADVRLDHERQVLHFEVPLRAFAPGIHHLELLGVPSDGEPEALGRADFQVR